MWWFRKPRAVYFWSWSLLYSLERLCQLHAHPQNGCLSFPGGDWGESTKVQSPGKSERGWDPVLCDTSSSVFAILVGEERKLVNSPGNVLGLTPSVSSAWIWDLVIIKSYSGKHLPSNCYFLVVCSRIALTMLKPSLPLAGNKKSFEWGKSGKEERRQRYSLVRAKSLLAYGPPLPLPLLSIAFPVTKRFGVGKTQLYHVSRMTLGKSNTLNQCLPQ